MAQARKRGGLLGSFGFQVLAAMVLGLGLGQTIQGLGLGLGSARGLVGLPVVVGLVGNRPHRGHATVSEDIADDLSPAFIAQQQAQGAAGQGAAASAGEEAAE